MSDKIKFSELVKCINESPSGGYVGIVDYHAQNGDIISVVGKIGCSYATMRKLAISELEAAIEADDFDSITVEGECYWDDERMEWNPRKRSCALKAFNSDHGGYFPKALVKSLAMRILEDWKNPKERANNNTNLTTKENGMVYNSETGSFNFSLLVENEYYKGKEETDEPEKVKIQAPETKAKELIRKRFERKLRTYTISEGKFKTLSIGGTKFNSSDITF